MMATKSWLVLPGFCAGCLLALTGCKPNAAAKKDAPPPEVTVSKPVTDTVTDYFEFPGQTAAVEEVDIRARVTGYLTKVDFSDGELVKKGQLLYEIDPRPYQAALDRAIAELARLRALQSKAKANLARSERLRPSGAVSEDEYEQHVANVAVYQASIQAAEAAVRQAQLDLEFTKITSPIDGRVSRTRITAGNWVQPGLSEDAILTTVVSIEPIYVYFNVDEQAMLRYQKLARKLGLDPHPDQIKSIKIPVEIGLADEKGFPHHGILDFADNQIDRTTGTIRTRGVFSNQNDTLTPGMFVRVRMPFGEPHPALLVSERAIVSDQARKCLLVVNKENVVELRPVTLGRLVHGMRVIETGLHPDDLVVVNGLLRAHPGEKVQPTLALADTVPAPTNSAAAPGAAPGGKPGDATPATAVEKPMTH